MPPSDIDPESKEALYFLNHGVQMFQVLELEIYLVQWIKIHILNHKVFLKLY